MIAQNVFPEDSCLQLTAETAEFARCTGPFGDNKGSTNTRVLQLFVQVIHARSGTMLFKDVHNSVSDTQD